MPNREDIAWLKTHHQAAIETALTGTPLSADFIAALACQETGDIWSVLRRRGLTPEQVLALCAGDTLDADAGRVAFPQTRAELLAAPRGDAMFAIARQALLDMAVHIPGYQAVAKRPRKFCHGFGLFQLDLQFFRSDPDYFLNRDWQRFEHTLARAVGELRWALKKLGWQDRQQLSDLELAAVGITYNTGRYKPALGLKQGHHNGTQYYGEALFDFLRLARTVPGPDGRADLPPPTPGVAVVAPPTPVSAQGPHYRVHTQQAPLRVRREPLISDPPDANVLALLPDGHPVRAVQAPARSARFIEIETSLQGALIRGHASAKFLVAVDAAGAPAEVPAPEPVPAPALPPIPAAHLVPREGRITRRRDTAGALSLNEARQPGRSGSDAATLRGELLAIANWLAVDDPAHLRYQPTRTATFCNVYAHDFCHLAGGYLPRVWWAQDALLRLARGEAVAPLIGATVHEQRANDLFRWLSAFGPEFGWRRTGTLTKLQTEANQGAVGLIVARRREDGRSGHIVVVLPEHEGMAARRNSSGEVLAPVQSQAGAQNLRVGTGKPNWWLGAEMAEAAFWLHG